MPEPRHPRGAIARRKTGVRKNALCARLGFVSAIAVAALFATMGPRLAHAAGRGGPPGQSVANSHGPPPSREGDVLDEASRWLGQGNPTPFREAWCRDFVNMVLERAGFRLADTSHLAIAALRLGPRVAAPRPGDLAVMRGHVTFFAGWDGDDVFLGLGGNQGHRVTVARFARRAVIAFVRPA